MTSFITYFRVSTDKQGKSGLGLEAQQESVRRYLRPDDKTVGSFIEVESGRNNHRPQLAAALEACKRTGSTLLIAKLDRLSRSVAFISALMDSNVPIIAADNPSANRLTLHILAAVAEAEAEAISTRTRAALAAAKARGTILGGFRGVVVDNTLGRAARTEISRRHSEVVTPAIEAARAAGAVSLRDIAKHLTAQGVTTPRGGSEWTATQVMRIVNHVTG